jgi:hypothetical protein
MPEEHILNTTMPVSRSRITTLVSILLAVVLVAGCAPEAFPAEERTVSMLMKTNVTSSAYDVVPLTWNVGQNTLQSSGTTVLHADNPDGDAKLHWLASSPAMPICVVQQWGVKDRLPLMTTKSQSDLDICTPPAGMQYQYGMGSPVGQPFVRWYAVESESFLTTQGEILRDSSQTTLDSTIMTVTEKSTRQTAVPTPKTLTLSVAVPAGVAQMEILYGSGSTETGFVFVEASSANAPMNTPDSIWLLRMNSGVGSWVDCGDLSAFGGNIFSDQTASFARVGSVLYFTHSHGEIGCIDTAAASPSITMPEKINTLLARLWNSGPKNAEFPIQAQLASDNGMLIIQYPDADWNGNYDYGVDTSGTVLGNLHVDKTSITSFDARGKQGSSIPTSGSISFPSIDLFQADIF